MAILFQRRVTRRKALQLLAGLGCNALAPFGTADTVCGAELGDDTHQAEKPRAFLIDTDTASDDAVALVMALRNPGIRVEAITVVAGNVDVEKGVQNATLHLRAV